MELNRARLLAGLPVITESKEVIVESNEKIEVHVSKKGDAGVMGDVIVIDAFDGMDLLAKMLGIPDGWKLTKVKGGFAAYNEGDRMTFFTNENDFESDEGDE